MNRNTSGPLTVKIGADNLSKSLSQKEKIIQILQKELEGFETLRENYDRIKDRRTQIVDKCESLARELATTRSNSDVRLDQAQKNANELRSIVSSLQNELQNKQYVLKDLRFQSEEILKESEQRQANFSREEDDVERIKSTSEVLKMEYERQLCQVNQFQEELNRIKQYHFETDTTKERIKGQIFNTQTFIRQLVYEESKLSEQLSIIEDQNNSIDDILGDLDKVAEVTKSKIREVKLQKQDIVNVINSRELERGRIQTQQVEKQKQLKAEREKEKGLKQATEYRKNEINKLTKMLREISDESEQIYKSNAEVQNINMELEKDLKVCLRHLENVGKNNCAVKDQLEQYKKVNLGAIKKLRKPTDNGCWVDFSNNKDQPEYETSDCFGTLVN